MFDRLKWHLASESNHLNCKNSTTLKVGILYHNLECNISNWKVSQQSGLIVLKKQKWHLPGFTLKESLFNKPQDTQYTQLFSKIKT